MEAEKQGFEQWAIVEIFGHQRIAGRVTEQTIGGCSFVRVDVPAIPERTVSQYGTPRQMPPVAGFTKLYGNGAIYAITFVDEEIAKATASQLNVVPIDSYTLRDALMTANPEKVKNLLNGPESDPEDDPADDHEYDGVR